MTAVNYNRMLNTQEKRKRVACNLRPNHSLTYELCAIDRLAASVVVVNQLAALDHELCEREAASELCNTPKNHDG